MRRVQVAQTLTRQRWASVFRPNSIGRSWEIIAAIEFVQQSTERILRDQVLQPRPEDSRAASVLHFERMKLPRHSQYERTGEMLRGASETAAELSAGLLVGDDVDEAVLRATGVSGVESCVGPVAAVRMR
eukprot:CAMPEP_0176430280 /NCGR_PEP_ID=MMETSP0127-20121128/14163_1 /TAXON_ID=938130 /ORGANISM="Platyophrya macrostoma, Strain WH" /LENGTH=129 /DNA_ID=CAMNT_0017812147 /DNA_START=192 /DNA_END=584 /DNA_ORIENTATION=-